MRVWCELFSSRRLSSFSCWRSYLRGRRSRSAARRRAWLKEGALLAFAFACLLCSSGRVSWYGRSWIIFNGVSARTYPPSAIGTCLRWGGVGLVVSRELRVPALCGCGGYARVALCGSLVASRPPGDLKTTTNPRCIALGPPPVSPSLHRASFQKSARGGRTPKRFYPGLTQGRLAESGF